MNETKRRIAKSGLRGAYEAGNRFRSAASIRGRLTYLGTFKTAQEAHSAFLAAVRIRRALA
jgi:hypothetical protein